MEQKIFPCWAIGINKNTNDIEIYTFVTNEKESEKAQNDYKMILGDNLSFVLQKKEPFAGW